MKIADICRLREARNWQDISDSADQWLGKYTYESLDRWPSKAILQTLIERYPADAGTIYRGMNFDTKEQYDKFINELPKLTIGGITSWSRSDKAAEQFALTKPTYQLNYGVMMAYDKQQNEKERLAGYRGLIIATEISDHQAIDVDKSRLGHESEIILLPGDYTVSIHKTIKRYADELADNGQSVEQIIRSAKTRQELSDGLVQYVIRHHGSTLQPSIQAYIYKLIKPTPGQPLVIRRQHDYSSNISGRGAYRDVGYGLSADFADILQFVRDDVFSDPKILNVIGQLAASATRQILKTLKADFMDVDINNLKRVAYIAKLAGMDGRVRQIAKEVATPIYQNLNRRRPINDPNELHDLTKQITDVVARISAASS